MQAGPAAPVVAADHEPKESLEPFGDLVPFGDPAWYQGVSLPQSTWQGEVTD